MALDISNGKQSQDKAERPHRRVLWLQIQRLSIYLPSHLHLAFAKGGGNGILLTPELGAPKSPQCLTNFSGRKFFLRCILNFFR